VQFLVLEIHNVRDVLVDLYASAGQQDADVRAWYNIRFPTKTGTLKKKLEPNVLLSLMDNG